MPINKCFVCDIVDLFRANPQHLIPFKSPSRTYEIEGQKQEKTRKRKRTSRKSSAGVPQKKIDLGEKVPKGETFKTLKKFITRDFFSHTSCWCVYLCKHVCEGIIAFELLLLLVPWPYNSRKVVLANILRA